jgi:spore coat protein U-like protein
MKTSNAKFLNKLTLITAVAVAAGTGVSAQAAGSATSDLSVSTNVAANCLISTTALAFGTYDPVGTNKSADLTSNSSGAVKVTCTTGSTATVALDNGLYYGTTTRRMKDSSTNYLSYELYSDSVGGTKWDSTNTVDVTEDGSEKTLTVYGSVAKDQNVPVGTYNDTVVATVTF